MKRNDEVLGSLALDLKRMAIGYHRGSKQMAARFAQEVERWQKEVDRSKLPEYIIRTIDQLKPLLKSGNTEFIADRSLMYSTLLQNFVRVRKNLT